MVTREHPLGVRRLHELEPSPRRRHGRLVEQAIGWGLIAPAGFALAAFVLLPMFWEGVVSLQSRHLTTPDTPWVGLANWRRVIDDGTLRATLEFTLESTLVMVAVSSSLGLALALALYDRPWLRALVGTVVVLPIATSLVISSSGWHLIFDVNGVANQVLRALGFDPPNWLNQPGTAKALIMVVGIWAQTGFALLLFQAALSQLPRSVIDAARVYGCWSGVRVKLRLIVPTLYRTIAVVVIVTTIVALRTFDQVYALTQGGPYGATRTLAYYSWEQAFTFFDLGSAAVTSTVLVALVLLVTGIEVLLLRRRRPAA